MSDVATETETTEVENAAENLTEYTTETAPVRGKGASDIAPGAGLGRRCGPDRAMAAARMIRMAVRHQSARHRLRRVNPHVGGTNVDAVRVRFYPVLGGGAGDWAFLFLIIIWWRVGGNQTDKSPEGSPWFRQIRNTAFTLMNSTQNARSAALSYMGYRRGVIANIYRTNDPITSDREARHLGGCRQI